MPRLETAIAVVLAAGQLGQALDACDDLVPGLGRNLMEWLLRREAAGEPIRMPTDDELRALLPGPRASA